MQIATYGKNIEVTAALREYIEKKINKLERFVKGTQELFAHVTLTVERGRHIIEVTIPINGMILRGEEASDNMYASIDQVSEKLERQLLRYKNRVGRKAGAAIPPPGAASPVAAETDTGMVVRTKRFNLKPQTTEEAILQLNLLGHDFYVFTNADSDDVNVLYRRRDGNYGLIEPDS